MHKTVARLCEDVITRLIRLDRVRIPVESVSNPHFTAPQTHFRDLQPHVTGTQLTVCTLFSRSTGSQPHF